MGLSDFKRETDDKYNEIGDVIIEASLFLYKELGKNPGSPCSREDKGFLLSSYLYYSIRSTDCLRYQRAHGTLLTCEICNGVCRKHRKIK